MIKGIGAALGSWIFYGVTMFNVVQIPLPVEYELFNRIIPAIPLVLGHGYAVHRYHETR